MNWLHSCALVKCAKPKGMLTLTNLLCMCPAKNDKIGKGRKMKMLHQNMVKIYERNWLNGSSLVFLTATLPYCLQPV